MTKIPPVYRQAAKVTGMIESDHQWTEPTLDEHGNWIVGLNPDLWENYGKRTEAYAINSEKVVDLCTYLFNDVTASPHSFVVPPNTTVEIELHPAPPKKTMIFE